MLRKKNITDISRQSSADSSSAVNVVLHDITSPSKQGKSRKQGKRVPTFTAFVAILILSILAVSTMKLVRQDLPMDKEHSTTFLMKSSLRKEKENTSIQKPPGVVTKQLLQTSDSCRNERTNTITLSMSEFCLNGGQSENDLLRNQFNWIERNLAPYANELFQEEDKEQDELTVVVMPNALCRQNERVNRRDITLTTQMSINKLTRLVAIAGRWNGPVSVALRVTSMEELHLLKDQLLKYGEHLDQVAFHLYFEGKSRSYPNNILRNVALDNIWSDYFAVFDVDLLPSPANTHQHLQSALNRHPQLEEKLNNKTVFVLPAWEIDDIIPDENITIHHALYPESKEMLLDRHAKNEEDRNVRIFRSEVYKPGHRTTDYPTWMSNSTDVSYPVVTKEYGYEPYIIGAKKGIPHFFPQFRGYGFNKISFYTELHYASYKLEVLRDFFIFHVNHKSSYSQNQISFHDVNRKCVAKFWSYLSKKYDAGYLKKEQEVVGFKVWNTRMREGLGYDDVFSDSEEEEEEEEDEEAEDEEEDEEEEEEEKEEDEEEEDKEEVQDEEEAQDEEEVRQKHDEEEAQGKQGEEDDEDEEEEQEKQEKRGEVEGNLVVSKIK
mmetsp:Transcript_7911/g.11752  ORF Transcript_7911/g.11752 Transcript_7911/m.11752 type:complete len:607 (+) Transcript_7911:85-1905(+)